MWGESVGKLQVASLDMNNHPQFNQMIASLSAQNDISKSSVIAVALNVNDRKVSLLSDFIQMEDWLEDLVDSRDRLEFFEIKDTIETMGISKENDLAILFSNPD